MKIINKGKLALKISNGNGAIMSKKIGFSGKIHKDGNKAKESESQLFIGKKNLETPIIRKEIIFEYIKRTKITPKGSKGRSKIKNAANGSYGRTTSSPDKGANNHYNKQKTSHTHCSSNINNNKNKSIKNNENNTNKNKNISYNNNKPPVKPPDNKANSHVAQKKVISSADKKIERQDSVALESVTPAVPGTKTRLSPAERLELAKKARVVQVQQYEESEKNVKEHTKKKNEGKVHFINKVILLEAATRGDVVEVDNLLKKGANPNMTNDDGLTALHQASIDNNLAIVKVLLKNGANVNALDKESWTPLHASATCGHPQVTQLLIDNGANLLAVNEDGNMPYDICEQPDTLTLIEGEMFNRGITQEQVDKTRALREENMLQEIQRVFVANNNKLPKYQGPNQESILHVSCANGFIEVTNFLLSHKASVNATDVDKWQPIHCAVYWGHINLIEPLLKHGAELNSKTKVGETALDLCPNEEIKQQLLDIREEVIKKGYARKFQLDTHSGSSKPHSVTRMSQREKMNVTQKDQKSEGAERMVNLKKLYEETDLDLALKNPGSVTNKAIKPAETRMRRRSSTNLFRDDINLPEKKCIIC